MIGDLVGEIRNLCLHAGLRAQLGQWNRVVIAGVLGAMLQQAGAGLVHQIESDVVLRAALDEVHDSQALAVVFEPANGARELVQNLLASVSERWVPKVVREHDGLGEILVRAERPGHSARDLRDL